MKILITGATGFVGRHAVNLLKDHSLTLLVRDISKASSLFGNRHELIDTSEIDSLESRHFDAIIHLAAFLSSKDDCTTVEKIIDANLVFGIKLLQSIRNNPPKLLINFGTSAQYKDGPQANVDAYFYSASKSAFEVLLKYYSETYNIDFINVIPYTIYGGDDTQKKVIDYIRESVTSPTPVSMTAGEQILDFIHVNDVADFVKHIIDNLEYFKKTRDKRFFLGTGTGTSIRQVASMIEQKYDCKCNIAWGALPYRKNDIMYAVAPQTPLINCGWQPSCNLYDEL